MKSSSKLRRRTILRLGHCSLRSGTASYCCIIIHVASHFIVSFELLLESLSKNSYISMEFKRNSNGKKDKVFMLNTQLVKKYFAPLILYLKHILRIFATERVNLLKKQCSTQNDLCIVSYEPPHPLYTQLTAQITDFKPLQYFKA